MRTEIDRLAAYLEDELPATSGMQKHDPKKGRATLPKHLRGRKKKYQAQAKLRGGSGLDARYPGEVKEDTISQIRRRVGNRVKKRSESYSSRVTGKLRGKNRYVWFFETGDWIQKLRATPRSTRQQRVEGMDVAVTCNCPSFRWNGGEHWAKANKYLYGRPRGTASFPEERDPDMRHGVCKHLIAVFNHIRDQKTKIKR